MHGWKEAGERDGGEMRYRKTMRALVTVGCFKKVVLEVESRWGHKSLGGVQGGEEWGGKEGEILLTGTGE